MKIIETKTELLEYLVSIGYDKDYEKEEFYIAVEALIFIDNKLVLLERSQRTRDEQYKLEGIGGQVHKYDENLLTKLQSEIREEIIHKDHEKNYTVKIEKLLEVRQVQFKEMYTRKLKDWVVVSYLCRYERGKLYNNEYKHNGIRYLTLDQLYEWQEDPIFNEKNELVKPGLSKSLIMGRKIYKQKYGNHPYYEVAKQDFYSKYEL